MKLILVPLAVMLFLTVLSVAGLGSSDTNLLFGQQNIFTNYGNVTQYGSQVVPNAVIYDDGGTLGGVGAPCIYAQNCTPVVGGGAGRIEPFSMANNPYTYAAWHNFTGTFMLTLPDSSLQYHWLSFDDFQGSYYAQGSSSGAVIGNFNFMLASSVGFVALVVAIMGIGALAGIHFFGSGESEISIDLLLKGTFFLTVWGILTALAYPLFLAAGFYMFLPYFLLCLVYSIGIINSVGSPQGND